MTTFSSAYRRSDGQAVEITSDLPRYDDAGAELRAKIAEAGGARPLYFRDDRPSRG